MYYMKISFLLACIVFAVNVYSQNFLIKSDGTAVSYKKLKWDNGVAKLTTDKRQMVTVEEESVFGLYEESTQQLKYKKPNVPLNEVSLGEKKTNGFQYLLKEVPGKINLYKEEIITGGYSGGAYGGQMTTTSTYYYAEKGNEFKNMLITGLNSKKDDLVAFKSFFTGDQEIHDEIESEDFVYNEKNMLKVIRKYNMKHFEAPTRSDYKTSGAIGIYTRAKGKTKEEIVIKVNDSIEYRLPNGHLPLSIRLPIQKPSKVCVNWDGGSYCELVQPIVFSNTYYLVRNFINKTHTLEAQNYREFKNYMSDVIQKK